MEITRLRCQVDQLKDENRDLKLKNELHESAIASCSKSLEIEVEVLILLVASASQRSQKRVNELMQSADILKNQMKNGD